MFGEETVEISLDLLFGVGRCPASEWDACAGSDNPFVSHAFFSALEESGSVSGRTGWLPMHLAVRDRRGPHWPGGRLAGVVPMYLKNHSFGEYVFDHGWAEAYEQAGLQYYPKLQIAVPFTPVTGPRLLIRSDADSRALPALVGTLEQVARNQKVSSIHATFCTEAEWQALGATGWLQRLGIQYHWYNRGYRTFDDFLGTLTARKRKAIRKERQAVAASGVHLRTLTGADIKPEHWDAFYRCYIETSDRKWGFAYLNRDFFHRLGAVMPEKIVLVLAELEGHPVAGALNLIGGDTLYGRNWGGPPDLRFLHFEACYYRAIEFAIAAGLRRVEAGAQGEHKLQRGYEPTLTYSAHWVRKCGVREVLVTRLAAERARIIELKDELELELPYRQSPG
ncbi:MAG: GNAT family N-acetyltransferase [Rhodospirillaceae bacterium]